MAGAEPSRLPVSGAIMADKSPRQNLSKKAGKSIKEKRADKRAKGADSGSSLHLDPKKR